MFLRSLSPGGAILLSLVPLLGCEATEREPPLPEGVREMAIERPNDHWARAGFTLMTPAIPPPIPKRGDGRIEVFLKLPPGGTVGVEPGPSGPVLRWPVGTQADRVESLLERKTGRWAVADVRGGTVLDAGDEEHHLYRPSQGGFGGTPLLGLSWLRSRPDAELAAHRHLEHWMRKGRGQLNPVKGKRLQKRIDLLHERGGCRSCHARKKPIAARVQTVIRATDASGWYAPLASLLSTSPLERYRLKMKAAEHPHITLACPGDAKVLRKAKEDGTLRVDCPDRRPVVGTLNVSAGLAAHDAHTEAVCASRQFLFEHLDPEGRAAFGQAFSECGIGSAPASPATASPATSPPATAPKEEKP